MSIQIGSIGIDSTPPEEVVFQVEMLYAGEGDSLLVTVPVDEGEFLILVDTGKGPEALVAIRERLRRLPLDENDMKRHLDLFIVTHIDEDHLEHAVALLSDEGLSDDEALGLAFNDIWFNGYAETGEERLPAIIESTGQADVLSTLLHDADHPLPHNVAFGHGAVQVPELVSEPATSLNTTQPTRASGSYMEVDVGCRGLVVTLLSPVPQDLRELGHEWDTTEHPLATNGRSADVSALWAATTVKQPPTPVPNTQKELKHLASLHFAPEETRANVCSIVVLLESKGRRLLLTGDGHPHVYEPALRKLREDRAEKVRRRHEPVEEPFVIDVVKVAHHGSSDNTTSALRDYHAESYLISTNGERHHHPDSESLARLIVGAAVTPTFYFNYPSARVLRWARAASELGGFAVKHPSLVGMTFELNAVSQATTVPE